MVDSKKVDNNKENDPMPQVVRSSDDLKPSNKRKQYMLVALVLLLLAALVASAYYVYQSNSDDSTQKEVTLETTYEDSGDLTYIEKSQQVEFYEGYDQAQSILDEGVAGSEDDPEATAEFYIRKSELALNNGKYEEGLEYAIEADKANPTIASASFAAEAAEALGDNNTAIEYYSYAADRTPDEQKVRDTFNGQYGYFIFRIEDLGGTYGN